MRAWRLRYIGLACPSLLPAAVEFHAEMLQKGSRRSHIEKEKLWYVHCSRAVRRAAVVCAMHRPLIHRGQSHKQIHASCWPHLCHTEGLPVERDAPAESSFRAHRRSVFNTTPQEPNRHRFRALNLRMFRTLTLPRPGLGHRCVHVFDLG